MQLVRRAPPLSTSQHMSTSCCVFHLVLGMYDLGATLRDALCGSSKHAEAPTGTALLASLTPSFPYLQRTSLSWPFCGLTLGPFPLALVFLSFSPFLPFFFAFPLPIPRTLLVSPKPLRHGASLAFPPAAAAAVAAAASASTVLSQFLLHLASCTTPLAGTDFPRAIQPPFFSCQGRHPAAQRAERLNPPLV